MNTVNKLLHPTNKLEQIQGVIEFYSPECNHTWTKPPMPDLISSIALMMFKSGESQGYRANVIRNALNDLEHNGMIDYQSKPYE